MRRYHVASLCLLLHLSGFTSHKRFFCWTWPGLKGQNVDLVLSCVDNYEARMAINQVLVLRVLCVYVSMSVSLCVSECLHHPFVSSNLRVDLRLAVSWTSLGWSRACLKTLSVDTSSLSCRAERPAFRFALSS